jgi:exosortase
MSTPKPAARTPVRPPAPGRPLPAAAQHVAWDDPSQHLPLAILGGLVLLLLLAYWDMLAMISRVWTSYGLYSHGWIIPLCAVGLLWLRWEPFGEVPTSERWIGVGLLVFGLVARLGAAYVGMHPVDRLSFLPCIFGVFIMVGGLNVLRWAWPALGFLVFMFPLPTKIENLVLLRLQTGAAICSTFVLQTLGVPAFRDSRIINISGIPLAVADACSGLRMVTIFVALAVAMVFLIERPWWDKFIILLSAIPIALIVNIVRISLTGLAYLWIDPQSKLLHYLAHDWAGLLMMPLALGILWLELQLLERLTLPVNVGQYRPVGPMRPGAVPVR